MAIKVPISRSHVTATEQDFSYNCTKKITLLLAGHLGSNISKGYKMAFDLKSMFYTFIFSWCNTPVVTENGATTVDISGFGYDDFNRSGNFYYY